MYTELRLLVKVYYSKAESVPVSYGIGRTIRPTIINSLFPVLVREKYHAGGWLLFIILLKVIIISRVNAT